MPKVVRKVSEFEKKYGQFCFTDSVMSKYLSADDLSNLKLVRKGEVELKRDLADRIAAGIREWALENGATHYCHWFQPINSTSSGKQNSFLKPVGKGNVIYDFSSQSLLKGEGDASSFPTGGLRSTFEARGISQWDVLSPVFIREIGDTRVLYIPTKFLSFNGEALDMKTPLIRSVQSLSENLSSFLSNVYGSKNYGRIKVNVGAEQEFFLVRKDLYEKRPDLRLTGRTLIGAMTAAGFYSNEHYYASLEENIQSFLHQVNYKLERIGVSVLTQHKEVAPNQFEIVINYGSANIVCDQNMIMNEIIKEVAERNGLVLLLHEKPYKGVNGSGKHTNWSLSNKDGENLFSPGKSGEYTLRFLLMISIFIKAVDEYGELLRTAIASYSNDLRLSVAEAPPTIISVFLGEKLSEVLSASVDEILKTKLKSSDAIISDRNRTSPIAFTGNKFEFRATGSSQSLSLATTFLNAIFSKAVSDVNKQLAGKKLNDKDIAQLISQLYSKHSKVVYNDNCYDSIWEYESEKRGIKNAKYTPQALRFFSDKKNIDMLSELGIYSANELLSRQRIYTQEYIRNIRLEAAVMIEMLEKGVIPVVRDDIIKSASFSSSKSKSYSAYCDKMKDDFDFLVEKTMLLEQYLAKTEAFDDKDLSDAETIRASLVEVMTNIRDKVDELEKFIPYDKWPYPSYERLLFSL